MDANDLKLLKTPLVKKTELVSIPLIRRSKEESKAFIEGVKSGMVLVNDSGIDVANVALDYMKTFHKAQFGEQI